MRDSGRDSRTTTVSPMWASLRSSCACSVFERAHDLRVAAVAARDVDAHGDRLVGLVGDDDALTDLLRAGAVLARRRRWAARARRRALGRLRAVGAALARLARARRRSAWRSSAACRAALGRGRSRRRWPGRAATAARAPSGGSASGSGPRRVGRGRRGSRGLRAPPGLPASLRLLLVVSSSSAIQLSSIIDVHVARNGQRAGDVALGAASTRRCSPARRWRAGSAGRTARGARSRCARRSSSSVMSRSSAASRQPVLSQDELRSDRQLVAGKPHGLAGQRLGHAGELEHHAAGLDHGDPALG